MPAAFKYPAILARLKGWTKEYFIELNESSDDPIEYRPDKGGVEHFVEDTIIAMRKDRRKHWNGDTKHDEMLLQAIDALISIRETANTEIAAKHVAACWETLKRRVTISFYHMFSFWMPFDELSEEFLEDLRFFTRTLSNVAGSMKNVAGQGSDVRYPEAFLFERTRVKTEYDLNYISDLFYVKYVINDQVPYLRNIDCIPPSLSEPSPWVLPGRLEKARDPIAAGGFANIYFAYYYPEPQYRAEVAVKIIRDNNGDSERIKKIQRRLQRELKVWRSLRHVNLLPLYGISTDFGPYYAMISPWRYNGCISTYIKSAPIWIATRLRLLFEIADALYYLHTHSVVHGDLTDRNVLITYDIHAQLCDFGLSSIVDEESGISVSQTTTPGQGSLRYMAPELLSDPDSAQHASRASDVYSLGVLIFMVLTGLDPYYDISNDFELTRKLVNDNLRLDSYGSDGEKLGQKRWNFVKLCCSEDPDDRPDSDGAKDWLEEESRITLERAWKL